MTDAALAYCQPEPTDILASACEQGPRVPSMAVSMPCPGPGRSGCGPELYL